MNSGIGMSEGNLENSLYIRLKNILITEAKANTIAVGDRLLPEMELAKKFQVSRNTLRKSLALLESEGLILRFPKKGTFLTRLPVSDNSDEPIIGINFMYKKGYVVDTSISVFSGIIEEAQKAGVRLMYINEREMTSFPAEISGFIFVTPPAPDIPLYKQIISGSIPAVCIGKKISSKVGYIGLDNVEDAKHGVEALIQQGCKKIGFWGNPPVSGHAKLRYEGFVEGMKEAGLPLRKKRICFYQPGENPFQQTQEFLSRTDADGIFVALSPILFFLIYSMNQLKIRIGSDIKLFCHDDLRPILMDAPSVYYTAMPHHEMGACAFQYLYNKIKLKNQLPILDKTFSAEICCHK